MKHYYKRIPHHFSRNVLRLRALAESSARDGDFFSPAVTEILPERQEVGLEWIQGTDRLSRILGHALLFMNAGAGQQYICSLLESTGKALAGFHGTDSLPLTPVLELKLGPAPLKAASGLEQVKRTLAASAHRPFHGDFGISNVRFFPDSTRPIFLDPIPSRFCPEPEAMRASIYYDIAQMVFTLWSVLPFRVYAFLDAGCQREWTDSFLRGYEQAGGVSLCRKTVWYVAWDLMKRYFEVRVGERRWLRIPLQTLFRPCFAGLFREFLRV
jgi:hypothetical protein